MPLPDSSDGACQAAWCAQGYCTCCDPTNTISRDGVITRIEVPECWGSSNNVKDAVQTHTRWRDFVIHDYEACGHHGSGCGEGSYPFNCRGSDCFRVNGDEGWDQLYHPACALEH
jgi:hypothetical protein